MNRPLLLPLLALAQDPATPSPAEETHAESAKGAEAKPHAESAVGAE
ncbi:MAG: hypothetical protein II839_06165 [Kiritimatiellae bacterium]|nr:hypothetical protein [Kiritimatiellia bacterium]